MTEQDAQHRPLASGHAHTHAYTTHVRMCECSHTCTCKERIGTYELVNIILLISKPLLVSFR